MVGMTPAELAAEILARAAALPPPNTAGVRRIRREYSRRLADRDIMPVARALLRANAGGAGRWVAYELVQHNRAAMAAMREKEVEEFGRGIASWDQVDCFACYIAGPAWHNGQLADRVIHRWARSSDRWWRRAAVVATVALNCVARGGRGDTPRTLRVCQMLAGDRDDMVVKALSWALRALSVRDPRAVRAFLAEHDVAPRVRREVGNKLRTGLKNP